MELIHLKMVFAFTVEHLILIIRHRQYSQMMYQMQCHADLYEAATIDGAGKWRQFFSITVPMITPIIFYNLVTQICQAFQEFNGPYIITNGGPRGSTTLISLLVYNYAFKSYDMGMASALAWIMFIIVCILTIIAFTSQKKWVYYSDER